MNVTVRRGTARAISPAHALAFRQRCQRLDQRTPEPLGPLVSGVGYVPTPGGATPYLALHVRAPKHDRRLLENAVFDAQELVDVPFARLSNVLAPIADAPYLLPCSRPSHAERIAPLVKAKPLDEAKRHKLADAVVAALAGGPLAADELRARMPEPLSVAFGEAGRKIGYPSLFTLVLRELQLDGRILRIQRERRLDRESYVYALPKRPLVPASRPAALAFLAERFFRAFAPANATSFAWWADASITEARAAVQAAGLVAIPLEGQKEPAHVPPDLLDELYTFEIPVPGRLAFVPFRDPFVSGCRDLKGVLPDERREVKLADWRGRLVPAGGGSIVHQHFMLQGGQIAGIWEYDRDEKRIRFETFDPLATRLQRAAQDAADELAQWIATELGGARFYGDERGDDFGRLEEVVPAWSATSSPRRR